MSASEVVILRTGTANLASVVAAFERLGLGVRVTEEAGRFQEAALAVLPGVGSFGACMGRLRALGLVDAVYRRVDSGRPMLGICLGMQVMCAASEESPGVEGICVIPATVRRFGQGVSVPQLGWNRVEPDAGCRVITPGMVYYANSYRLESAPEGWAVVRTNHGGSFIGAVERGPVVLCQFHPELSGAYGSALLRRWVEIAEGVVC
ncbi:MAG: imidazole glycerol phosphate synthase subunit HisH [Phycisphaerales bacterium]|nr:imidazole glycerol phosphate synthase subunit HisH [Planctomycetota bacterium]MCH8507843.1 imidazole glycerol phosphate synthase subunit HisH [Phycisphaerales bacterium]